MNNSILKMAPSCLIKIGLTVRFHLTHIALVLALMFNASLVKTKIKGVPRFPPTSIPRRCSWLLKQIREVYLVKPVTFCFYQMRVRRLKIP